MVIACEDFADAASCDANEAKYSCMWDGEMAYCDSYVDYSCDGGPQTASCKILTAANSTEAACAKATTKAACGANEACEWDATGVTDASCITSPYGLSLIVRKLGSKVEEARYTQGKACNTLTTKQACLAEPLPAGTPGRASANSPSPARSSALSVLPAATCIAAALLWVALMGV
jgi:hypothetical protein